MRPPSRRPVPTRRCICCNGILSALPSPLWGGVGGGGAEISSPVSQNAPPPSPALTHKGGGSRPNLPLEPRSHATVQQKDYEQTVCCFIQRKHTSGRGKFAWPEAS